MIVTPIPHGLDLGVSRLPRSTGLHMSDIYGALFEELKGQEGWPPEPLALAADLGFCLEDMLEASFRARHFERPEELRTAEGIAFSPDLICHDNGRVIVADTKLKWMTSGDAPRKPTTTFPPKYDKVLVQLKAYARSLDTQFARIYMCFVNGTGRGGSSPMKPELLAWDLEFTPQELADNWQMLMNFARHRKML